LIGGRLLQETRSKKWGPRLGPGAPEGAFQLPMSFSHRRVGSSILASLSEAGGNDPRKVSSKPLPPRPTLCANRHLKRAHVGLIARSAPGFLKGWRGAKPLIFFGLTGDRSCTASTNSGHANQIGTVPKLIREITRRRPISSESQNLCISSPNKPALWVFCLTRPTLTPCPGPLSLSAKPASARDASCAEPCC